MKTILFGIAVLSFAAAPSFAAGPKTVTPKTVSAAPRTEPLVTTTTRITTTEHHYPWGVGVATAPNVTETTTAASIWIQLDDRRAIHALVGVESTSPFNFGVGALYKRTMVGTMAGGLHLGGGAGFGTRDRDEKFFVRFTGVAGLHFEVPGVRNILVQADMGPSFLLCENRNNFSMGALSPLLGLSLTYVF